MSTRHMQTYPCLRAEGSRGHFAILTDLLTDLVHQMIDCLLRRSACQEQCYTLCDGKEPLHCIQILQAHMLSKPGSVCVTDK